MKRCRTKKVIGDRIILEEPELEPIKIPPVRITPLDDEERSTLGLAFLGLPVAWLILGIGGISAAILGLWYIPKKMKEAAVEIGPLLSALWPAGISALIVGAFFVMKPWLKPEMGQRDPVTGEPTFKTEEEFRAALARYKTAAGLVGLAAGGLGIWSMARIAGAYAPPGLVVPKPGQVEVIAISPAAEETIGLTARNEWTTMGYPVARFRVVNKSSQAVSPHVKAEMGRAVFDAFGKFSHLTRESVIEKTLAPMGPGAVEQFVLSRPRLELTRADIGVWNFNVTVWDTAAKGRVVARFEKPIIWNVKE